MPNRLNLKQAGATAVIGLTALQGVDDALPVKRGEHVIVHGASGGVGTCAMQFAKLRRARARHGTGDDGAAACLRCLRYVGARGCGRFFAGRSEGGVALWCLSG